MKKYYICISLEFKDYSIFTSRRKAKRFIKSAGGVMIKHYTTNLTLLKNTLNEIKTDGKTLLKALTSN